MTTPPTTTNGTATAANNAIGAAGNAIVTVVEAMIITDQPWLGTIGVKQLWQALFGWIAGYFVKAAQNGATFAIIDVQVGNEESGISAALAALVAAEKTGNASAIQAAVQVYANCQSALVHDDGSSVATGL